MYAIPTHQIIHTSVGDIFAYGFCVPKSPDITTNINRIEEVSPNFGAQPVSRFGYPRQDPRRFTQGLASIGNSDSLFDKYRQMILENARRTTTFVPVLVQPVPVDDTKIKAQPRWRPSQRA